MSRSSRKRACGVNLSKEGLSSSSVSKIIEDVRDYVHNNALFLAQILVNKK